MRQPIAILVSLLLSLPMLLGQSKSSEEGQAAMSDRVQAGLRGPVESTTEARTYADTSGKLSDDRFEHTTVYDPSGRVQSIRNRNSDGSYWVSRYEYSNSGQLLKTSSGNEAQALLETHYSYDSQRRIEKIISDDKGQPPALFRYELGHKTKIQTWAASDYRPNTASGGSPFDAAEMFPNIPGGGTTTTIYDEHDRPIEVQVRDADDELLSRVSRAYDAQGHVTDEKQLYENLPSMFPPEVRQKLVDESGLSAEQLQQELNAQLTNLMQGHPDVYSVSNQYDSAGRLVHTSRRIFNHEEDVDTTYNQQGDKESEITRSTRPGSEPAEQGLPSYSEARYSYQYDQHENWTEQKIEYRSSPDAAFQPSSVTKRSLTYY